VIGINPPAPAKSVAELIALVKACGGKLTLASYGTGTIQVAHLHEPLHRFVVAVRLGASRRTQA
jgi:hypothetical protein